MRTMLLRASLFSFFLCQANAQWVETYRDYSVGYIRAFTSNGQCIFAGTGDNAGTVLVSTNGGSVWSKTALNSLVYCLVAMGTNVYAGTWGGVYRSTDNGQNWIQTGLEARQVFALAASGTSLFAGTSRGGLFLSKDSGSTWTGANAGLSGGEIHALATNGRRLFAGDAAGQIFLSTDDGSSWNLVESGLANREISGIASIGKNWFAGAGDWNYTTGSLLRSTNDGTDWTRVESSLGNSSVASVRVSGTNVFASVFRSGVYLSVDYGASWTWVGYTMTEKFVFAVEAIGPYLFAGGNGNVWRRPLFEILGPEVVNCVRNPSFESDTDPWQFFTDGVGGFSDDAAGPVSPHAARLDISGAGTNVQLYQAGISLKAGVRYRLSFKAYSSTGHDLSVYLHKHGSPYTDYGLNWQGIDLGNSWKTYETEFTAENFAYSVDDARLRFWLAPYAAASDKYCIDDVVLEETEPNLIVNGRFEWGRDPWMFYTDGSGSMDTTKARDGSTKVAYLRIGGAGTNVQLYQPDISLEARARYRLSFRAYSTSGHDIDVYLQKHEDPYTNYGLDWSSVDLDTVWKTYERDFTADNFEGKVKDGRLRFWLAPHAVAGDEYFIDDVVLMNRDTVGTRGGVLAAGKLEGHYPNEFELSQNYPNPFNPGTNIKYELPTSSMVKLSVFDMLGREVSVLVNDRKNAGVHEVKFDGSELASGVYFYRLQAGDFTETKRLVLLR